MTRKEEQGVYPLEIDFLSSQSCNTSHTQEDTGVLILDLEYLQHLVQHHCL